MMQRKFIIATIKSWNIKKALQFKEKNKYRYNIKIITRKENLIYENIKRFNPEYIFFPHWSWIIPENIYKNFECVVFHMTDLPFGRGGSPLQNLIIRGIKNTKISAIRVIKGIDTGPIYMKKSLSLSGSAENIYKRASNIIFGSMISYIIENKPKPIPQRGEIILFKRRKPEESKIPSRIDLKGIYNYIRMLDAEGYPKAFLETEKLRFEFRNAKKYKDKILAEVIIKEKV